MNPLKSQEHSLKLWRTKTFTSDFTVRLKNNACLGIVAYSFWRICVI